MQQMIERYFIGIIPLFTTVALTFPNFFIGLKQFIPLGLGLIMFGIGMNTSIVSFQELLTKANAIMRLILLRFILMPFWALLLT